MKKTHKTSRERDFKNVCTQPHVFFENIPLLNGLPFNKLGDASQGNLQLVNIAYFRIFSKKGKEKCLIK